MASLIHLVDHCGFPLVTGALVQLTAWFPFIAWSMKADRFSSVEVLKHRLLVKSHFVFDSTSDLWTYSRILFHQRRICHSAWHIELCTHTHTH